MSTRRWSFVSTTKCLIIRTPWVGFLLTDREWNFLTISLETGWELWWGKRPDPLRVGESPYLNHVERKWNIIPAEVYFS